MGNLTTKQRGDAGEYYAISQFIFAGKPAVKMPDNWPGYDLIVDVKGELKKISVKMRMTTKATFSTEHCKFNFNDDFDFIVFIFKSSKEIRSWIVPVNVAKSNGIISNSENENYCRLSFKQLMKLDEYEDNWLLNIHGDHV